MQQGIARGGFADGEELTSRVYPDVLVIHRPSYQCQLYVWDEFDELPGQGVFVPAPDWPTTRRVHWDRANDAVNSPKHDVMAHPSSAEVANGNGR